MDGDRPSALLLSVVANFRRDPAPETQAQVADRGEGEDEKQEATEQIDDPRPDPGTDGICSGPSRPASSGRGRRTDIEWERSGSSVP